MTTVCDQMRRASELVARDLGLTVFLMNVPATWQTQSAQQLYRSELKRLGCFLSRLGGRSPSNEELAKTMREYESARSAIRAARGFLSPRQFSETVADFNRSGKAPANIPDRPRPSRGVPVALLGGPLLEGEFVIFDLIEKSGGTVVLDATETGERTMPASFDRQRVRDAPLTELAKAYFGSIPDAFRRPNGGLYSWLRRELNERNVQGIVLRRHVWCDTWHAEVHRLREWADLPVLDLYVADEGKPEARTATQLQSFLEMLK